MTNHNCTKNICSDCQKEKPIVEFHNWKNGKCGKQRKCKICQNARGRGERLSRPRLTPGRPKHPDQKRKRKDHNLRHNYGITIEQYEQMYERQGGRCAICRGTNNGKPLSVDHDHKTKKVRGLLCVNCNHAIGKLCDDPDIMRAAIRYLER